jgi:hypothetical protein
MTHKLYGQGLLLGAADYATHYRVGGKLPAKVLTGLAFGGGSMVILVLAASRLWQRQTLLVSAGVLVVVGALGLAMGKVGAFDFVDDGRPRWWYWIQAILFVAGGLSAIALAVRDWFRSRTAVSTLLLAWVAGVLTFATAINWTTSGRHILPMLPAVALLLARRLPLQPSRRGQSWTQGLWLPLAGSLAIALVVAWSDYRLAASAREAAAAVHRGLGAGSSRIWFEGHWGFQYYMEKNGAKPVNQDELLLRSNDVVVVPLGNSYLFPLPEDRVSASSAFECPTPKWVATINGQVGAGYYSDGWGPLPYVFGPTPGAKYVVHRIR